MARKAKPPRSLKRDFVTPEGVDLRIELGSGGARAGSFLLDMLLMFVALIALNIVLHTLFDVSGGHAYYVVWLLGFFVLRNGWFILFELGGRGATPGKRLMGLRVVARDGARLLPSAVIARNAMREIELFLPISFFFGSLVGLATGDYALPLLLFVWSLLFAFFPLFNRDRLRVGDLVAGTWVVRTVKASLGHEIVYAIDRPRQTFSNQALDLYGEYELQTLEEVLRRGDSDAIAIVAASIRRKADLPDDGRDYEFLSDYYAALCARLERGMMVGRRRVDKFTPAAH